MVGPCQWSPRERTVSFIDGNIAVAEYVGSSAGACHLLFIVWRFGGQVCVVEVAKCNYCFIGMGVFHRGDEGG